MAHQVLAILLLGALHKHAFFRSHLISVRVAVLSSNHVSVEVPVDLELGHSRLLRQNMSGKAGNIDLSWRVFNHFLIVILYIHVVANTHEFLVFIEGAGQ